MKRPKRPKDTISEQDFNAQTQGSSSLPENDSPGNSGENANKETLLGVNYPDTPEDEEVDYQ